MTSHETSPQKPAVDDDILPELPPLEDDGSVFGGDDDLIEESSEHLGLDDSTSEDEENDRFGAFDGINEQGALLDGSEGSDDLVIDEEQELLAGAEIGLLEESDEGDGRDADADGLVGEEDESEEDGGAEGTDEDPAAVLEGEDEQGSAGDASDDEGIDDDARFQDGPVREALEREPWPSRADVAWSVTRVDAPKTFANVEPKTSDGKLIAAVQAGALVISSDGGETFDRVQGCQGTTAITIVSSKGPLRKVAAALYDAARECTGIVLVRIDERGPVAELLADFVAEDDEQGPVDKLLARDTRQGLELLACAEGVARLLKPKA